MFDKWSQSSFDHFVGSGLAAVPMDVYRFALQQFMREAVFEGGPHAVIHDGDRSLENPESIAEICNGLAETHGGQLVATGRHVPDDVKKIELQSAAYAWPDTVVAVCAHNFGYDYMMTSRNRERETVLLNYLNSFGGAAFPVGSVGILVRRADGSLWVRTMGTGGVPFVAENYSPQVVDQYNRVVEVFNRKTAPSGRLVLLEGEPGCGKTYMVRSFISALEHTKFIMIPSHLVQNIGDPGMIDVLMEEHNRIHRSMTLVVEDADMCLSARMADNMAAISSMLNMCDGIMGSLLDIRIIATTNTKIDDIDKALTRPGRLCEYINIDLLSNDQASEVYHRLTGQEHSYTGKTSLAQIYADANVTENRPTFVGEKYYASTPRRSVGFF